MELVGQYRRLSRAGRDDAAKTITLHKKTYDDRCWDNVIFMQSFTKYTL